MKKQNTKLPKWFKGQLYDKGDTVKNPFSGEVCELNATELSMYDFIVGSQLVFEMQPKTISTKMVEDFHRGLNWFRSNNPSAYMVLLD
jgi:hypothetical protein